MKLSVLKTLSTTLLILMITMSAFMASNTNLANAATVQYFPTYARVSPIHCLLTKNTSGTT